MPDELEVGTGPLPDPTKVVGQGPLADRFSPVEKARRDETLAVEQQEWLARAETLAKVLVESGDVEPNEARMMLGLDLIITGPEDDPRPWVTYYVPKDQPDPGGEPGATAIAPSQITMCDLCGAVVGSVLKHYAYAHPDQDLPTTDEESTP
jgi:hypothetical protein